MSNNDFSTAETIARLAIARLAIGSITVHEAAHEAENAWYFYWEALRRTEDASWKEHEASSAPYPSHEEWAEAGRAAVEAAVNRLEKSPEAIRASRAIRALEAKAAEAAKKEAVDRLLTETRSRPRRDRERVLKRF